MNLQLNNNSLISDIRSIIDEGRLQAYSAVNIAMVSTYWNVGRRIVEEEQHGEQRAEYGKEILKTLAKSLVEEYGDNFQERRLRSYRQFYLYFKDIEKWHSRVPNLTFPTVLSVFLGYRDCELARSQSHINPFLPSSSSRRYRCTLMV